MGLRAVILDSGTRISPFGDLAADGFFAGETVGQAQLRALTKLGCSVVKAATVSEAKQALAEGPALVLLDRIFVTARAIRSFIKAGRTFSEPVLRLALSVNASVEWTLPLQDVVRQGELIAHDVIWYRGGPLPDATDPVAWLRALADSGRWVPVPKREIVAEVWLPTLGDGPRQTIRYPVSSTIVVSVEHWLHLLWLNQLAFGIRWIELLEKKPLWGLWRALTAFSLNRHKILDRLVYQGSGCDIHPAAYLSSSILGRGVKVGAGATVRNSIVGDGAVISDHAVLLNTVVGAGTLITENSFLVSDVIYPDATVGNNKLQVSLIGRGAYVHAWAGFIDAKFVGHVKVDHRGALVSSERSFLGSVVGHRAKVASKVLIQPGREIPNDAVIVMRPDEIVSVVPHDLPPGVPVVRSHGTLVPLGQER